MHCTWRDPAAISALQRPPYTPITQGQNRSEGATTFSTRPQGETIHTSNKRSRTENPTNSQPHPLQPYTHTPLGFAQQHPQAFQLPQALRQLLQRPQPLHLPWLSPRLLLPLPPPASVENAHVCARAHANFYKTHVRGHMCGHAIRTLHPCLCAC